jgi:Cache domain
MLWHMALVTVLAMWGGHPALSQDQPPSSPEAKHIETLVNKDGEKDKRGKAFHDEIMKLAQQKGAGWVDYWLPKPGQTEPSHKWSYVKAVKAEGVALVGGLPASNPSAPLAIRQPHEITSVTSLFWGHFRNGTPRSTRAENPKSSETNKDSPAPS